MESRACLRGCLWILKHWLKGVKALAKALSVSGIWPRWGKGFGLAARHRGILDSKKPLYV